MKTKLILLSALMVGGATYLGACVDQPNAGCPVASFSGFPYWIRYNLVDAGTGGCGDLGGDMTGFQKYHVPGTSDYRLAYRIDGIGQDWDQGRSDPADPDGTKINGFAKITEFPAADHFCDVTDFTAPEERFEKLPDEDLDDGGVEPGAPELYKKYDYTSMRVVATTNAPGTVLKGTLNYTEDTCTAVFNVAGIWPPAGCDPANNEAGTALSEAKGPGYNIDCDPKPVTIDDYKDVLADGGLPDGGEPNLSHILGSGINPTFAPVGKPIHCVDAPASFANYIGTPGVCEPQLTVDEISKL